MPFIIGYTYEAEIHCFDCAYTRFGEELDKPQTIDFEGNPLHPVFDTDEIAEPQEGCGSCGEPFV